MLKQVIAEMLKNGKPEQLCVRFNNLSIVPGYAIENDIGLAIGKTFETIEEAYAFRSKAWAKAWEKFDKA